MKKIFYSALAFAMVACNSPKADEEIVMGGTIDISVTRSEEVTDGATDGTTEGRLIIDTPTAEDLKLDIIGQEQTYSWTTLAEFKSEISRGLTFKAAPYTVILSHGEKGVEGYSKPYFEGSCEIEVPGYGLSAKAEVVVALANSIVAIATTSNFDGYFQQQTFKVITENSKEGIEWNAESEEMLFLNAGAATIKCVVVKPSGNEQTITVDVELKAQTRHTVVFDLPNAGSAEFTVKFDGEIVDYVDSDFEMNDNA